MELKSQLLHMKSTFESYANATDQVYSNHLKFASEKLKMSRAVIAAGLVSLLRHS